MPKRINGGIQDCAARTQGRQSQVQQTLSGELRISLKATKHTAREKEREEAGQRPGQPTCPHGQGCIKTQGLTKGAKGLCEAKGHKGLGGGPKILNGHMEMMSQG